VGFQLEPKTVTRNRELNQQTLVEGFDEELRRAVLTLITHSSFVVNRPRARNMLYFYS
jgi:hypothetical protein